MLVLTSQSWCHIFRSPTKQIDPRKGDPTVANGSDREEALIRAESCKQLLPTQIFPNHQEGIVFKLFSKESDGKEKTDVSKENTTRMWARRQEEGGFEKQGSGLIGRLLFFQRQRVHVNHSRACRSLLGMTLQDCKHFITFVRAGRVQRSHEHCHRKKKNDATNGIASDAVFDEDPKS